MDPPRFPEPQFSQAHVCGAEFGYMLVSQASRRRFFCPRSGHCVPTQFGGSVSKCYEITSVDLASSTQGVEGEEEHALVTFEGKLYRYCPSRPMGLKTCRIDFLKLEAHWQDTELGELSGENRWWLMVGWTHAAAESGWKETSPRVSTRFGPVVLENEQADAGRIGGQTRLARPNSQDPVKEIAALQLLKGHGHYQHSNIEELEEAMADDTTLYKVTPWYGGGELFDLAPMPEAPAKKVFAQILDALDFVNSKGLCHRDVSLENILMDTRIPERGSASRSSSVSSVGSCISVASSSSGLSGAGVDRSGGAVSSFCNGAFTPVADTTRPEMDVSERRDTAAEQWIGRPRLCDFGMSVRIPRSPVTGKTVPVAPQGRCGKNTCVSPEVFYDEVFDAQAVDTWSVGTTLFMALLGVQPWEEVGDYKFQAIAEGKNLDVVLDGWKLRHTISEDAVNLLQAMLTADPEERLSDIRSILAHPWFHN